MAVYTFSTNDVVCSVTYKGKNREYCWVVTAKSKHMFEAKMQDGTFIASDDSVHSLNTRVEKMCDKGLVAVNNKVNVFSPIELIIYGIT